MRKFGRKIEVVRGFYPSQGKLGMDRVPGSFIDGQNVILRGLGLPESVGPAASTILTGAANVMLVGSAIGGIGSGTIVIGPGGDIYAVGSGTAFVNGGNSFAASSALKFYRGGVLYVAGLNAPGAGSIATPAPVDLNSTKVSGSYSVKFTKRRTQTGIESNVGPVSNVVNTKASDNINKQLKITLPGSGGETHDVFPMYVTPRNYGAIGPHYWFNDIPVGWNGIPAITGLTAISPGVFYLDINDTDLDPETRPPTDHFYPPTGTFFFFLGNVAVIVGTFGGTGVSPSIPGIYEAFPPTYTTFLPEAPLGIRGRATDGWVYVLCQNSLNACILSGSEITPIVTRTIWPETGVANGNAAAMVGGGLYVWAGNGMGALRTNGDSNEPDSSFAKPVQSYFKENNWGSNVVVGFSPEDDGVVYCNGSTALVYHRSLDAWSSPINLGITPVSAVTYQGGCYLSTGLAIYRFGAGGGAVSWYLTPVWDDADEPESYKIIETLQGSGSNGVVVDLLKNLSGTSMESLTLNGTHSDPKKTYIKDVRSFTAKFSGTTAGQRIEELVIKGLITDMRC